MADEQDVGVTEVSAPTAEQIEAQNAEGIFKALTGVTDDEPDHQRKDGDTPPDTDAEATESDQAETENEADDSDILEAVELEGAKAALKRAGMTEEIIGRLSPKEIRDLGTKQKEFQSNFDRISSERGELAQQLEALDDEDLTAEDFEEGPLRRLAEIDMDAAKAIQAQLLQNEQTARDAELREAKETAYSVLDDLTEDYPQLADPAMKEKVISTATALSKAGTFNDMEAGYDLLEEALGRAAKLILEDTSKQTAQAQLLERTDAARNGQVDAGGSAEGGSAQDADEWAFNQLRDPNNTLSPEQIAQKREKMIQDGSLKRGTLELVDF